MPYLGPAIHWPTTNVLIHPDPDTGLLPGATCPVCGSPRMTATVVHHHGERLVSLSCTAPHCTSAASPAVPY